MKHIILLIFFMLGVWAQEVGVPFVQLPKDVKELNIGLSRDGKTFYTYENNTLIHWNMNPVQIIDSVKITDPMFKGFVNFDFTPDGKKIIFSHPFKGVGIYSLQSKKFIRQIPIRFRFDRIFGSKLVTIDKDRTITIRDLDSLDIISRKEIPEAQTTCQECNDNVWALFKSHDEKHFAIMTEVRVLIFDSRSFEFLQEYRGDFPSSGTNLYLRNGQLIIIGSKQFEINTLKFKSPEEIYLKSNHDFLNIADSIPWYISKLNYHIQNGSKNIFTARNDKKLYQIADHNWLIISSDGYFDGSPDSRKYLYMRTSSGESVPINDATYNKFHKQINLKN